MITYPPISNATDSTLQIGDRAASRSEAQGKLGARLVTMFAAGWRDWQV